MQRIPLVERGQEADGGAYFARPHDDVEFFSTGCKTFDLALGGGWAMPKIANIVGDKSTGKTLLCIEASANFLRKFPRGKVRYRESEAAFLPSYAQALGMPIEKIDFGSDPLETVEDWFEDMEAVIEGARTEELCILDSLDALSSRDEMKRDIDAGSYGTDKAKMMSKMFRSIVRSMERKKVALLVTSQIRDNITSVPFAKKYRRTGGHAMDFYASHVVYLAQTGVIKVERNGIERPVGISIKANVEKNKVGLPLRSATFNILFGYGTDDWKSCIDYLRVASGGGKQAETRGPLGRFLDGHKLAALQKSIATASEADYQRQIRELHRAVEKHWWETEKSFLPQRKKYVES